MSIYTQTARFDTGRGATETEMRQFAPSIFAVTAHESRSERFKPIPTIEVLASRHESGESVRLLRTYPELRSV
ncbi:hypothetical protein SAMN05216228_102816 [Rhizobium tibeticum]|uniref:Uncharacterized protein n=1 Tax=Rhizobium tibeticum TaxID=501024 RepID=A0A1H8TBM6_9HYPH|nr:hypothetical protein [Rhizobium tibeticum]SEI14642.1 hypothetical protein RTCCBAU85039_5117 [Rhizobium tibeticum]SEO88215.1 hypothetical protein SAMN05216228_102816 [Rhizobium tibeticum]